jgi:uncharacterized protein YndB with AHSA1/START domain
VNFQADHDSIKWKLHLRSSPKKVYNLLATDAGRARFWAESAREENGVIHFQFPNGIEWQGQIQIAEPCSRYQVEYFGNSLVTFTLKSDGHGGTDLSMIDMGVSGADRAEVTAGWVSVLLALKAAADFQNDLRNHDPSRSWDQGYVDN